MLFASNELSHNCYRRVIAIGLCLILLFLMLAPEAAFAADKGVTTARVVLRKSASKTATILQTLPDDEPVTILGTSGSWYRIRYGNYTGYIMKKYVKVTSTSTTTGSSNTSSSSKSAKIKALGTAPGPMRIGDNNSDVKKLQQALNILGYYDGKIDSDYGKGTTAAVKAYQNDHKLTADGVAGRNTVKSIFGSCASTSKNSALNGSSTKNTATTTKTTATTKKTTNTKYKTVDSISEIGTAPSPTRKGSSGTNVVKLQQALECLGYYTGAIDGDYGAGTVAAVKRFQKNRGMNADGIAGSATISILFGTSNKSAKTTAKKTYKTETLSWFSDNVTRVIPKNARFTIKDVYTGKTFEAVRWSGYNHIDAEPRTAADTKTMKSIYGGSWSWSRRPILILYNGHVYAASMNGMPHGTTTIANNNFAGHFCIHFKNSKTHETNRVDAAHQNAVNRASRATW